jgi:transcriptional regulator with XRE-family HTH domain
MVGRNPMGYRTKEQVLEEIVRLRKERGISQTEVAEALGVDQSAVSKLESGERGMAVAELATIAELLGVSVESLLVEEDEAAVVFRGDDPDAPEVKQAVQQADQLIDNLFYYRALVK